MTELLAARNIVKRFGGILALNGVSFDVRAGEVHALCGENGAGKSTLIKLLAGVHPHGSFEGELILDGAPARLDSTRAAETAGIAIIHQELALFRELTVAENMFLGVLPRRFGRIDWPRVHSAAREVLGELQCDIDPQATVGDLGIAQQQLVEIARALVRKPRVLVLDEPTAALARNEIDLLLALVRRLRARGVACVYVSHKLDEVFALADRITVLRDGVTQGTLAARSTTPAEIIRLMVGRSISELYPRRPAEVGPVLLRVSRLTVAPHRATAPRLHDISFEVAAGEVLGIGGLMGAGRSELLLHLIGQYGVRVGGSVDLRVGKFSLVTEDRKRFGLVLQQGVAFNLTLASLGSLRRGLLVDRERETVAMQNSIASLRIKASEPARPVANLSGGNQQKIVIGKALLMEPSVLLLDEPARGIDVGAKLEVYELMNQFTARGKAIVMVSSEMPELLGMSDRIVMLHEGRIGGVFTRGEATQEALLAAAMGRLDAA